MDKFTPAPWEHEPEQLLRGQHVAGRVPKVYREHLQIASVCRSLDARIKDGRCETAEANARLIAAAPDLLEAARDLIAKVDATMPEFLADDLAPLRAAIARATGEA